MNHENTSAIATLPPPLPERPPALPISRHRPEFSGTAREYFGIWIVNLILGILTLGIWSAWGTVRTRRYFYAHTRLAGSAFEYIAEPLAILKGRLIAYAVVIVLLLASHFALLLYVPLIFAVALALPALVVWSLRFRARNSLWRGLGFRFDQQASDAYLPFLLWQFLVSMSMGLLYPFARLKQHEFVVQGHRYGLRRFVFNGDAAAYYRPFLVVIGLGVLGIVLGIVLMVATVAAMVASGGSAESATWPIFLLIGFIYAGMFVLGSYLHVRYVNLMWNSSRIGGHRFESNLRARDMLWIHASNTVLVILSLGLALPWAKIRLARYRAEHFTLIAAGDLDDFVAASDMHAGATGAELVDALDPGFDFGI
ncbi:YjgN family protein [Luteimonas sp. e5]